MRKLLTILAAMMLLLAAEGQEVVTGLQYNEAVRHARKQQAGEAGTMKTARVATAAALPFFDDFTRSSTYPDAEKWIGESVFINNDFALYPPNYGTATFDAIDKSGKIYSSCFSAKEKWIV